MIFDVGLFLGPGNEKPAAEVVPLNVTPRGVANVTAPAAAIPALGRTPTTVIGSGITIGASSESTPRRASGALGEKAGAGALAAEGGVTFGRKPC